MGQGTSPTGHPRQTRLRNRLSHQVRTIPSERAARRRLRGWQQTQGHRQGRDRAQETSDLSTLASPSATVNRPTPLISLASLAQSQPSSTAGTLLRTTNTLKHRPRHFRRDQAHYRPTLRCSVLNTSPSRARRSKCSSRRPTLHTRRSGSGSRDREGPLWKVPRLARPPLHRKGREGQGPAASRFRCSRWGTARTGRTETETSSRAPASAFRARRSSRPTRLRPR